ncbi:MAG TPA: UvrD-helicase domain-containing protein, partial [Candidatus Aminicenantes bacterium]|nr:UvrD-helicase domain-containing protein [Candidatus Aminicenantes bacterium]
EAFPYLYLKLSDRFVHFLFDEFQDTSELQFAALAPLIDEVLSGRESASLFLVGDRKQAIYRWRGGQASLMEEARLRELIPALDHRTPAGFSETLAANWRSDVAVVDFNNGFWGPEAWPTLAGSPELAERLAAHFASAVQTRPAERKCGAGFVSVGVLAPSGGAEDGEESPTDGEPPYLGWLLSRVREFLRTGYDEDDLAVLVRRNEEVCQVVATFTAAGLRTVAERSLTLGACSEVRELLSAMRFLDFPPDDLSFFQFVTGRIFQTRARQIVPGELPAASEWAVRRRRGQPLYTVFRELCPRCWQRLIAPFFNSAGILPAYDLIADLLGEFAVYENFPDSTPMLFGLSDWLHRLEGEGVTSVSAVLARWLEGDGERESAGSEGRRGVHVLTMHQAKGLEFPVVMLPLTDHRSPNRLPILVCGGELTAARKDWARLDPELAAARDRETLEEWIDALNLLYVAFTRPIQVLEVGAFPRSQAGGSGGEDDSLPSFPGFATLVGRHPLLAGLGSRTRTWGEWPHPTKGPADSGLPRRPVAGPRMATRDWQREMLVFSRRQATPGKPAPARSRGEAIHGTLSLLPEGLTAPELPAAWVRIATGQGLAPAEVERVEALLRRPEVAELFTRGEAACEREVLTGDVENPVLLRLDRLVVLPGEFWVVEFKTGPEPAPAHREQVRRYAATLTSLFPGRTPRGFLLYLDRGEVEEVPC